MAKGPLRVILVVGVGYALVKRGTAELPDATAAAGSR
jgi:hypothetical protein